jgi:ABC-type nitrate/sulfonate/bicarbonate transport system substrate-binding protein
MIRMSRRQVLGTLLATTVVTKQATAQSQRIRIGLPTKTYWPTTVAEAAVDQKLFAKEGIAAEVTVYRGAAECFEALAAGAADLIVHSPSAPAAAISKGVKSKVVAKGAMGMLGWQLMVPAGSKLEVKDLAGKKVAITSAGSGSDLLALWTMKDRSIEFVRVPVGGGGIVPNLLVGNVDAAVVYSPLSYQIKKSGEARTLIDFASAVPQHLAGGWIASDKFIQTNPGAVQKALNALYGGLAYMRANRAAAIKLIVNLYELPADIAAEEFENTILKLEVDGSMDGPTVEKDMQLGLDLAKLSGMKDLASAQDILSTQFRPVPTRI